MSDNNKNNQDNQKQGRSALGKVGHGLRVAFIPNFKKIFFTTTNVKTFSQIKENFEKLFNARQPNNSGLTFNQACQKHNITEEMIKKSKFNTFLMFYIYNVFFLLVVLYSIKQIEEGHYLFLMSCVGFTMILFSFMIREAVVFYQFNNRYLASVSEFVKYGFPYIPLL